MYPLIKYYFGEYVIIRNNLGAINSNKLFKINAFNKPNQISGPNLYALYEIFSVSIHVFVCMSFFMLISLIY